MHNDTAYSLLGNGMVQVRKQKDGKRVKVQEALKVLEFTSDKAIYRHGVLENGQPKPYKGYKGDSNYCIEISQDEKGRWQGEVISTYQAYQIVRQYGKQRLRHPELSISEKPLVMRLMLNDTVRLEVDGQLRTMRIVTIKSSTQILMAEVHESNTDARNRDPQGSFSYVSKMPGSLQKAKGRRVSISSCGKLHDPGFRE